MATAAAPLAIENAKNIYAPVAFPLDAAGATVIPDASPEDKPEETDEIPPVEEEVVLKDEVTEEPEAPDESVDTALIKEAVGYGFTEEQATAFGDKLSGILGAMDRQAAALMRQELVTDQSANLRTDPQAAPAEPADDKTPDIFKKLDIKIDEDHYDDVVAADLKAMAAHINQQQDLIAAMADILVNQQVAQKTENVATVSQELDKVFSSLGDEFNDTFGKAPMQQLTAGSPQVINRQQVYNELKILEQADKRAGKAKATVEELAKRVIRAQHADKLTAGVRKDIEKKITTRSRQGIAPPSGRATKTADGRTRALAVIKEKMAAMGLNSY